MFYRSKFDGFVGHILKRCGYDTVSDRLDFWPVGATREWVKLGKKEGWKPVEAAAVGLSQIARLKAKAGQIDPGDAQAIARMATMVAYEHGATGVAVRQFLYRPDSSNET